MKDIDERYFTSCYNFRKCLGCINQKWALPLSSWDSKTGFVSRMS